MPDVAVPVAGASFASSAVTSAPLMPRPCGSITRPRTTTGATQLGCPATSSQTRLDPQLVVGWARSQDFDSLSLPQPMSAATTTPMANPVVRMPGQYDPA